MSPRPALRLTRASVFAGVCVTLAGAGHAAVSHVIVAPWAIVLGFAAVLSVAWVLTGTERSLATILGGLLGGQFVFHALFAAGHAGPSAMHRSGPSVLMTGGHGGTGVTLAHLTAAVVSAWWLRRGERAVWRLARRVAWQAGRSGLARRFWTGPPSSRRLAASPVPVLRLGHVPPPCGIRWSGGPPVPSDGTRARLRPGAPARTSKNVVERREPMCTPTSSTPSPGWSSLGPLPSGPASSQSSSRCSSGRDRRTTRLAAVGGSAALTLLVIAGPAAAHVTANPDTAEQGSDSKVSFRVPNEQASAQTTALQVDLPLDHPIAAVSVRPIPGWAVKVARTKPAAPIKSGDGEITQAVSKITWSGGSIAPGQFQEFDVSMGPLPTDTDRLVFKAAQTYSGGEAVHWDQNPGHGGQEPDHPAPAVLRLTPQGSGGGHMRMAQDPVAKMAAPARSGDGTARSLGGLGLAAGVIGIAVGGLGLARTRNRS